MAASISKIGPYNIESELGRGGMAVVYRAIDTRNGGVVALKVLSDPAHRNRFYREAVNAKRLYHPNIVQIYDSGEADGHYYIAMQYIDGGSLSQRLKQHGSPLSFEQAISILEPVAAALDYAHAQGLLHRDIKSSNILLTGNGQVLLADFGVAQAIDDDATQVTRAGYSIGTPAYMSPEQAKGVEDLDARSDIYSLGVVAYEMLTGKKPHQADSSLILLLKIINELPTPPEIVNPQINPNVAYELRIVFSKDRSLRHTSAGEFVRALKRADALQIVSTKPSHPEEERSTQIFVSSFTDKKYETQGTPPKRQESLSTHSSIYSLSPEPLPTKQNKWVFWLLGMGLVTIVIFLIWYSSIYLSPLLTTLSTNGSTRSDTSGTLTPTATALFTSTTTSAQGENIHAVITPTITATGTAIAPSSQSLPISLTATSAITESPLPLTVPITVTQTPFIAPTSTETATTTPSVIATESVTPSPTPTATHSATPTPTASLTATNTDTPTATHTQTSLATESLPAISAPTTATIQLSAFSTSATVIASESATPTLTVLSIVNTTTRTPSATTTLTPKPIATDQTITTTTVSTTEVIPITLTATLASSTPIPSTPSVDLVATIIAIDTLVPQIEGLLSPTPTATATDTVTPTSTVTITATPTPTRRSAPATLGQVISIDASDPKLSCTGASPAVWFNGTQVSLTKLKDFTLPTNEVFEIVVYEHGYNPLTPGNHAFVVGRPNRGRTVKLDFTNANSDPEYIVVVVRFRTTNPRRYIEQLSSNTCRIRIGR